MADVFKLSEASKLCGISIKTLQLLIGDGLLPVTRTSNGHALLAADDMPTWQQCRTLIEQQRGAALLRAGEMIQRIQVELEAIGNDISEARENPQLPLGVDLLAARSREPRGSDTTLSAALRQLDSEQWRIVEYDRALREIIERDWA
ncbi:DNA-binding protein [Mycolicibacterium fortuitum]|uniref:DNA-binding protein n=1 Tax=Mycolicibacterium fortuitum TaxID=1766 RepID=UPI001CE07E9E|nr:DNA-binding protein [Mycolicibacterium fortuitum]MCA4727438.1 DNA-binding protein [Mycolicibacterium fortuitum]